MKPKANPNEIKITAMLPLEVHTATAVRISREGGKTKGFTFQSVITALLREWGGGTKSITPEVRQVELPADNRFRGDLERLVDILEHAGPSEKEIVLSTIRYHAERLKMAPERKGMPPNPSQSSRSAKDQHRPAR